METIYQIPEAIKDIFDAPFKCNNVGYIIRPGLTSPVILQMVNDEYVHLANVDKTTSTRFHYYTFILGKQVKGIILLTEIRSRIERNRPA